MTDIEDLGEALFEIEDLVEEIADPEELLEDFVTNPLMILFALVAGVAGIVAVLLFLLTVTLLVLSVGPVIVIAVLTLLSFLTMALAFGAFLYVRTDIPSDLRRKIDTALDRADETPRGNESMTEEEAITELKHEYAKGNLDDREMEQALEDALTSDDPEKVVEQHKRS